MARVKFASLKRPDRAVEKLVRTYAGKVRGVCCVIMMARWFEFGEAGVDMWCQNSLTSVDPGRVVCCKASPREALFLNTEP